MADNTETEVGATPTIRAINKLRAIAKACQSTGMAKSAESATALADSLESSEGEKRKSLDAALARRRTVSFSKGDKAKATDAFVALYGKATLEVVEVLTVGGDENKRGGRTWLKAKNASGNVTTAPASCFELA